MKRKKRQFSGFIFVIFISLCSLCFAEIGKVVEKSTQAEVLLILRAPPLPSLEELGKLWLKGPYLTPRQLDAKYGPSKEDVDKVKAFARKYELNFKWVKWRNAKLFGSTEGIKKAFGENIIPEELKDAVVTVLGFPGVSHPSHKFHPHDRLEPQDEQETSREEISRPAYTPPQVAGFYNYPELDGAGECIGILAMAGQYNMADIEYYFKNYIGLPVPEIINVDINEPTEPPNPTDSFEVTMDIEVAASIAPKARIVVYNCHTNVNAIEDIYEVFLTPILDEENNPSVLSFSFAYIERIVQMSGLFDQEIKDVFDNLFKFAALKGITICAASGDWGSSTHIEFDIEKNKITVNLPSVSFPAAHPLVMACGGTTIKVENGKILEETVWNNMDYTITLVDREHKEIGKMNGGASTGGVSLIYPLPGYQKNVKVPLVQKGELYKEIPRYEYKKPEQGCGVPDVSANADYINSPYLIYNDGKEVRMGGGASAATPLWAGLIARINQALKQRVGFITPTLYQLQVDGKNVFRKIIKGTNGCYIAYPNEIWNPCTGLGSPDGKKLLEALKHLKQD